MVYSKKQIKKAIKKMREGRRVYNSALRKLNDSLKQAKEKQNELEAYSPFIGESFVLKIENKKKALNGLTKNSKTSAIVVRAVADDIKSVYKSSKYKVHNLQNMNTTIAARYAGIQTSVSSSGSIRAILKGVDKDTKNEYRRGVRLAKKNGDEILNIMGAYEKSYGIKGRVSNSDEVMQNVATYVQQGGSESADDFNDFMMKLNDKYDI